VLPVITETFHRLLGDLGIPLRQCAGLALSFCGLVDSSTARIISTNAKYDDAPGLDLQGWCREAFDLPFRAENDARMALLGEWHAGAGMGFEEIVMMTIGTGIGGAAMLQGRLLRGKHFQAGCLGGHFPVLFDGRRCTCGALGCAEAEASAWSLPEVCRSMAGFESSRLAAEPQITFENLFRHAEGGDSVATRARDRCLAVWSAAAIALIHAYDPEIVLLGGGVMKSAPVILPFVQSYVDRHAWTPWGRVDVRSAQLGNDAALLGAIPLLSQATG
jgi:glucokinase